MTMYIYKCSYTAHTIVIKRELFPPKYGSYFGSRFGGSGGGGSQLYLARGPFFWALGMAVMFDSKKSTLFSWLQI